MTDADKGEWDMILKKQQENNVKLAMDYAWSDKPVGIYQPTEDLDCSVACMFKFIFCDTRKSLREGFVPLLKAQNKSFFDKFVKDQRVNLYEFMPYQ